MFRREGHFNCPGKDMFRRSVVLKDRRGVEKEKKRTTYEEQVRVDCSALVVD
jgi:hypothetical protein